MPLLFIHLRNAKYCARDDGAEFDHPEAALALGIRGALDIAGNEVSRGSRSVAVEVNVEQADGTRLLTSVVTVSISPLMVVELNSREAS